MNDLSDLNLFPQTQDKVPDEGTTCWICLGDDKPLLWCGCACRGSSGWAHVECVAKIAFISDRVTDGTWIDCPTCKQTYTGKFGVLLSEKLFDKFKNEPPDSHAYNYALFSLSVAHGRNFEFDKEKPLLEQVNKNLRDSKREGDYKLRYSAIRRLWVMVIGFEKNHNKAAELKAEAFEIAKNGLGKDSQEYKEFETYFKAQSGQTSVMQNEGKNIYRSMSLSEDGHHEEAYRIAEEGLALSTRENGPTHPSTALARTVFDAMKRNLEVSRTTGDGTEVLAKIRGLEKKRDLNGSPVLITKWLPNDEKYIVKQIVNHDGTRWLTSGMFKAMPTNLLLGKGTRITLRGLVSSPQLNGSKGNIEQFDEDKGRYMVSIPEKQKSLLIKPENCRVILCIS